MVVLPMLGQSGYNIDVTVNNFTGTDVLLANCNGDLLDGLLCFSDSFLKQL